MAVYTHFGTMEDLVEAVVLEGFRLLEEGLLEVVPTDDPLADVAAQTRVYVDFAAVHRDLYGVMFGTVPLGHYRRRTPAQLRIGRKETLDRIGANLDRAVEQGRIDQRSSPDLAFLWWSAVHGYTLLETSGHIHAQPGRTRILRPLLVALFIGLGDDPVRAERSAALDAPGIHSLH